MDPVEKTLLVAARLPAHPHVVEKRDGRGRRYCELRYWVRGGGKSGRKDGIYLGRLNPIQMAAVRQVIADAWPQHKKRTELRRILNREYRETRRVAHELARQAGYSFHGCRLRKKTHMKANDRAMLAAMEDPYFTMSQAADKSVQTGIDMGQALCEVLKDLIARLEAMMRDCRSRFDRTQSLSAKGRIFNEFMRKGRTYLKLQESLKRVQEEIAKDALHAN